MILLSSMIDNNSEPNYSYPRLIYVILSLVSIITLVYIVIMLLPLMSTFFIFDDLTIIDFGPQIRTNPELIISLNYCGWWRPLGFGLPGLTYLLLGLNSLSFHIVALGIHSLTAIAVFFFIRKLIDALTAQLAFLIYVTSVVSAIRSV